MQEEIPGNKENSKVTSGNRIKVRVIMVDRAKVKAEMGSILEATDSMGSLLWPPTVMLCLFQVDLSADLSEAYLSNKL